MILHRIIKSVPSIAMDANGNFVICWYDFHKDDLNICAQRYQFNGAPLGTNYLVNQRTALLNADRPDPSVALSGDRITFTWPDYRTGDLDINAKIVTWDWDKVDEPGDGHVLPKDFALLQNCPNPFNATTAISYQRSDRTTLPLRSTTFWGRRRGHW